MDSRKSVRLPEVPQPGSVSQDVFVGEGCVESKLAFQTMTKCAAVYPEVDTECRENRTFRKVVTLARAEHARAPAFAPKPGEPC